MVNPNYSPNTRYGLYVIGKDTPQQREAVARVRAELMSRANEDADRRDRQKTADYWLVIDLRAQRAKNARVVGRGR